MTLCSYVVIHDFGFAPNPYWGYCTLAVCTPNHKGCKLQAGDWIVGNSSTKTGNLLIYAMQISEVLDFDSYYRNTRFADKIPRDGSWMERCGDNIYFRGKGGKWTQGTAFFHETPNRIAQDTKHPRVFISDHFFYFGENAPEIPRRFQSLIKRRQGVKYHTSAVAHKFVNWLEQNFDPGVNGEPRDRERDEANPECSPRRAGKKC
jgi:hypothetical protein